MISVITVNYKTKPYLERMLESLFLHHDHTCHPERSEGSHDSPNSSPLDELGAQNDNRIEVIVIENGSGDDLSSLCAKYPQVRFIFSEKNLGFAGGCNLGIKQAKGDLVLLVNPDIIFDSNAAWQIAQRMRDHPDVGVGGANLKNPDGSQQACVWRFPKLFDQLLLLFKIPHLFSHIESVDRWLMHDFDYSRDTDVDQVMGAFFCMRRELLDDIGLLDDGFFMWYEEVDFCKRAKNAGWRVRYFHDVVARHKKGSSFDAITTFRKQAMVRRSLRRYMRKHHGWAAWLLFTLLEPLYIMIAMVSTLFKPR